MSLDECKKWESWEGQLINNIVISQVLIEDDAKIAEDFIKTNIVDDDDIMTMTGQQYHQYHEYDNCPNLMKGLYKNRFSEKFLLKKSIKIEEADNSPKSQTKSLAKKLTNKNQIKLTIKDLARLDKPRSKGAFGSIHFLEDYDLDIGDAKYKNNLIIKVQKRDFSKQDRLTDNLGVALKDRCFGYAEVTRLMKKKLNKADSSKHSNLYQSHFYAASTKNSSELDLYIIMNKCQVILDDLIKKVHQLDKNHLFDRNFFSNQKMPTSFLNSVCKLFFDKNG